MTEKGYNEQEVIYVIIRQLPQDLAYAVTSKERIAQHYHTKGIARAHYCEKTTT